MAEQTKIEWADHTFNPWEGCQKVAPECDNCYAEARNGRFHGGVNWGPKAPRRRTSAQNWQKPRRWNKQADAFSAAHGRRQRVFCASLADIFDNAVDPAWRDDLWALIRECDRLDWLLLTKRPQNIAKMLPPDWGDGWPHVWLGTSAGTQKTADQNIPHLLAIPAAVHFVSAEPLLGPVDISIYMHDSDCSAFCHDATIDDCSCLANSGEIRVNWVICGGESGPNARPMHPDWARSLREQCQGAGVSFFFKQWGEFIFPGQVDRQKMDGSPPTDLVKHLRDDGVLADHPISALLPDGLNEADGEKRMIAGEEYTVYPKRKWILAARIGKANAGRLLDGREWNEVPR